ncbi:M23 family metallopeptidase [Lysinibacillus louembei]|uniref:M23 family metallopeptidase n=1 Tax=Lysinibacillus louembei TaxID=1470088 RepID=A0ABZ0RUC6_9BACI|nr:M23 family metallopeptidase [Lysinibacillus louembei]WPK11829.1 M23 family metallopeptidase [Lysinibacillus louembei]
MADFICPVKGNVRLTSPFGWRMIAGNREWHQGVDLASTGKVPIYASADGIVIKAQPLSTYGNVVMIRHTILGKRMDTNYAHLDSSCVKVGQRVRQGEQIGIMGNTGRSYGVHLHFEIHNGEWKIGQPNAVDAMKYIHLNDGNEDLTMSQYNELKQLIAAQEAKVNQLTSELNNKENKIQPRKASSSHAEAWKWAEQEGLLNGQNPEKFANREQLGSILKRFYDKFIR